MAGFIPKRRPRTASNANDGVYRPQTLNSRGRVVPSGGDSVVLGNTVVSSGGTVRTGGGSTSSRTNTTPKPTAVKDTIQLGTAVSTNVPSSSNVQSSVKDNKKIVKAVPTDTKVKNTTPPPSPPPPQQNTRVGQWTNDGSRYFQPGVGFLDRPGGVKLNDQSAADGQSGGTDVVSGQVGGMEPNTGAPVQNVNTTNSGGGGQYRKTSSVDPWSPAAVASGTPVAAQRKQKSTVTPEQAQNGYNTALAEEDADQELIKRRIVDIAKQEVAIMETAGMSSLADLNVNIDNPRYKSLQGQAYARMSNEILNLYKKTITSKITAQQRIDDARAEIIKKREEVSANMRARYDARRGLEVEQSNKDKQAAIGMAIANMTMSGSMGSSFATHNIASIVTSMSDRLSRRIRQIDLNYGDAVDQFDLQTMEAASQYEIDSLMLTQEMDIYSAKGRVELAKLQSNFVNEEEKRRLAREEIQRAAIEDIKDHKAEYVKERAMEMLRYYGPDAARPFIEKADAIYGVETAQFDTSVSNSTGQSHMYGINVSSHLSRFLKKKGISKGRAAFIRESFTQDIRNAKSEQEVIDIINENAISSSGDIKGFSSLSAANKKINDSIKDLEILKAKGYKGRFNKMKQVERTINKNFTDNKLDSNDNMWLNAVGVLAADSVHELYAGNVTGQEFDRAIDQFPEKRDGIDDALRKARAIFNVGTNKYNERLNLEGGIVGGGQPANNHTISDSNLETISVSREEWNSLSKEQQRTIVDRFGFKSVSDDTKHPDKDVELITGAIGQFESGSNYKAVGPKTKSGDRAYGRYQIMGNNIPSWSEQALGRRISVKEFRNNPALQDKIAKYKIGEYYKKYSNVEDVASMWFSGRPMASAGNAKDVLGTSVPNYIAGVRSIYNKNKS